MEQNFTRQLFLHASTSPEKPILRVLIDKEYQEISYRDLINNALHYQQHLAQRGVRNGDVVILILHHSLELIYAYFGCVLNGSIPSIMPYLTEKLIPEKYQQDLDALFSITLPKGVITFRDFAKNMHFISAESENNPNVLLIEEIGPAIEIFENLSPQNLPGWNRTEDDIALLQHSSGTTGLQKGVALAHKAIFNQLESYSEALKANPDDVVISWLPLYHDMGLIAGFLMPIFLGIPLVIMSPFTWVRAPHLLMQAISEFNGTLCWLPNFAYNFCAKKIRDRDMENIDLSSLRAVINCSEPMRKPSHDMFLNVFSKYGFRESALATSYAMAENVFAVTQGGINESIKYDNVQLIPFQEQRSAVPYDGVGTSLTMVSAGKPIAGTEVRIVNIEGNFLPDRQIGEVVLKSNCMLSGYYKREDATNESFINGWFKTGDYGYMADKEVYITGRKKDLIIVGGKNIYPKDIETIAMEVEGVHPGRAVAFGIFNENKGTEDVVLIAEVGIDHVDRKDEIAAEVRAKVTRESAIALRQVLIVDRRWLIKTSSGKIARALNKEKYLKQIEQSS